MCLANCGMVFCTHTRTRARAQSHLSRKAACALSTFTSDPLFYIIHYLLLDPHPLGGARFPPATPGLFLWFRKWRTCHRKQRGVWDWPMAKSLSALVGGVYFVT